MSDTSTFDPDAFMAAEVEGASSLRLVPVPDGDYTSIIDKLDLRQGTGQDGKVYTILDITHALQEQELREALERDTINVRQSIFLDIDPTTGGIDMREGKNTRLGRLRDAVGQNGDGPWNPRMLEGAGPLLVHVTERPDKNDPDTIYNDVSRTAPLAA